MRRVALIAACAAAVAAVVPAGAGAAVSTGSISGTVTAAASHLPVAGVRVCAVSEEFFEETEEFCAHSGANGAYSIGELPEATYFVEFNSSVEGLNYVFQTWDARPNEFEADPVKVTTADVPGIDAELSEGGMLGGLVTSHATGAPVAGVEVCAEPRGLEAEYVCGTTDGAGRYTLVGLSGGRYRVGFRPPEASEYLEQAFDGEAGYLQADPVIVRVGAITPGVNGSLLEGGRIGGRVTDAITHAPIADITACVFSTLGNEYIGACGESAADGSYLIKRIPPGTYTVHYFAGESHSPGAGYGPRDYTGVCGGRSVAVPVVAGVLKPGIDTGLVPTGNLSFSPPSCVVEVEGPPKLKKAGTPKPKRCAKGTKSKVVHGKRRCVKVRKHRRTT